MLHLHMTTNTTELGLPQFRHAGDTPFAYSITRIAENAETFSVTYPVTGEGVETVCIGTWTVRDNKVRLLLIDPVEGEVVLKLNRPAHECAKLLIRHLNDHLKAQMPRLS